MISELQRVLKKDGTLLVTTPNILSPAEILHNFKHFVMWLLKDEPITHIRHFNYFTIKRYFSKMKDVRVEVVGFGAAFLDYKKFGFLHKLDRMLGKLLPFLGFDMFVYSKK